MTIEKCSSRKEIGKNIKVLRSTGLLFLTILGYLVGNYFQGVEERDLFDKINIPGQALTVPCYGDGSEQYSSVISVHPTDSPPAISTKEAVLAERQAKISATVVFQQSSPDTSAVFADLDPSYLGAVVRMDMRTLNMGETGGTNFLGTGLIVQTELTGEGGAVYTLLTHNHPDKNSYFVEAVNAGEQPQLFLFGVDKSTGRAAFLNYGSLVGCTKLITGGEHVADLFAVRIESDNLDSPFPISRIGGPCLDKNGKGSLVTVSYPLTGNGLSGQPLKTNIVGPYTARIARDERGVLRRLMEAKALANVNSSGAPISAVIPNVMVCGVLNWVFPGDNTKIGFSVLPAQESMENEIRRFSAEQVKRLQR